ncbi:MAG: ATP-binding protein [Gemmatimonadaceae bacterium]
MILSNLGEVRRAGERVAAITRQLLQFARRQQVAPVNLDLAALVEDNAQALRQAVSPQIRLEVSAARPVPSVSADRSQLEQVLINLVVNARDAMPTGGTITVDVRSRRLVDAQVVGGSTLPPGEYVVLSVADTGSGIPDAVRARLFEPFFHYQGR